MGKFRRELLQILFGALGFALLLQYGLIKVSGPFFNNVMWGAINMIISRTFAYILGGKGK